MLCYSVLTFQLLCWILCSWENLCFILCQVNVITMPQKLYKDSLNCSDQHVITSIDNGLLNNTDHFAVIFCLCMYIQLNWFCYTIALCVMLSKTYILYSKWCWHNRPQPNLNIISCRTKRGSRNSGASRTRWYKNYSAISFVTS